jgi:hypothetical protein
MYELQMEQNEMWEDVLLETAAEESSLPDGTCSHSGINWVSARDSDLTKLCPVEPAICSCSKYNKTNAVESAGAHGMR